MSKGKGKGKRMDLSGLRSYLGVVGLPVGYLRLTLWGSYFVLLMVKGMATDSPERAARKARCLEVVRALEARAQEKGICVAVVIYEVIVRSTTRAPLMLHELIGDEACVGALRKVGEYLLDGDSAIEEGVVLPANIVSQAKVKTEALLRKQGPAFLSICLGLKSPTGSDDKGRVVLPVEEEEPSKGEVTDVEL